MDYQLFLDFTHFILIQVLFLGSLLFFRKENKSKLGEKYEDSLGDYRRSGILSYLQLKKLYHSYSRWKMTRFLEKKAKESDLDRSLCTHLYKVFELHHRDEKLLKRVPFFRQRILKRVAAFNLERKDFEFPSKDLEEMLEFKQKFTANICVENTLVNLNAYQKESYVPVILNQLDQDKLSLLVFSFEKIKSESLKKSFARIALVKLPGLKNYLVEALVESPERSLRWMGYQQRWHLAERLA